MHPALSLIAENVVHNSHFILPALSFAASLITNINTPVQHSLLVASASWAFVWIVTILRVGIWSRKGHNAKKSSALTAGGFFAFAQICERAARDSEGIWWTKAFLPLLVFIIPENGLWTKQGVPSISPPLNGSASDPHSAPDTSIQTRSRRLLIVLSLSAMIVLATPYNLSSTTALGLCSSLFTAAGLILLEDATRSAKDDDHSRRGGFVSANGSLSRRYSEGTPQQQHYLTSLRDVAGVMAVACGIAAYLMESFRADAVQWGPAIAQLGGNWKVVQYPRMVKLCLVMTVVGAMENALIFMMLNQQGALRTSFVPLAACLIMRLKISVSFSGVWFTIVCALTTVHFLLDSSPSSSTTLDRRTMARVKRIMILFGLISLSIFSLQHLANKFQHLRPMEPDLQTVPIIRAKNAFAPVPMDLKKGHPADQLIKSAEKEFQTMLDRQSKTLADAVAEYRRRYGIPPPPHFDKWFEMAQKAGLQLVDEFDTINELLLPFWALKPSVIRARVRQALGMEENALIGMMIRNGEVVKVEGGQEWQQKATIGMMDKFVQFLPDMDLAFNVHDEPRIVVPHDKLSTYVESARKKKSFSALVGTAEPRNSFSDRPSDMNDGRRFEEAKTTVFNRYAHQQTWTASHLSCSVNSPARSYDDQPSDNLTSYAISDVGFVYNQTAFSNICNSPSLSQTFGFFDRPNAFNIAHDLIPIFSQSKISSYQDILYPSPWYWDHKAGYISERDMDWDLKNNSLYWRGSTTGGFSRNGGWRRQHRQHIVTHLNAHDTAKILVNKGDAQHPDWQIEEKSRADLADMIDVHFSHIGQCDPGDCDAQREFFDVTERVNGQDAWGYKHLLDMDGNAFSGRFYSFLYSKSMAFKMAVFGEWHREWLRPWVHYVPLSLRGEEHAEVVRYFAVEEEGKEQAKRMAGVSTEWAGKVLRNVDFEVWFFRLLLEYGRIIDDDRDIIGYPGP